MQRQDHEYRKMKEFLSFYCERYLSVENLPPEKWPVACLEELEKKNMRKAVDGLRQAINDCVERSFHFDHAEVEQLDTELRHRGIVTLSELRRKYSKGYARILQRGRVKNETEYHLIRNIYADPTNKTQEELNLIGKLISDYEDSSIKA